MTVKKLERYEVGEPVFFEGISAKVIKKTLTPKVSVTVQYYGNSITRTLNAGEEVRIESATKDIAKLEQTFHDWYTDRWNNQYSKCKEPGWAISKDVSEILFSLQPFGLDSRTLRLVLSRISGK